MVLLIRITKGNSESLIVDWLLLSKYAILKCLIDLIILNVSDWLLDLPKKGWFGYTIKTVRLTKAICTNWGIYTK